MSSSSFIWTDIQFGHRFLTFLGNCRVEFALEALKCLGLEGVAHAAHAPLKKRASVQKFCFVVEGVIYSSALACRHRP